MIPAVIYARYSSHGQNDASIEQQVAECRAYAEQTGYTILDVYADRAQTGTSDKRPGFQQMIADAAKRQFDFVIVWKLDRFARNRYDSAHYKAILKRAGVRVISAKEQISDTPEGIILEGMLEAMAEYYSANLAQNVVRGMKDNAERGRFNGGRVPWGYKARGHKLVADPVMISHVRFAFRAYADGIGKKEIAAELNARGVRTSSGRQLTTSSFDTIFPNTTYIGQYTFDGVVAPDVAERIVDDETFNRVQRRLDLNHRAPSTRKAPVRYLLHGKIFCGLCGAPMIGESGRAKNGEKYRYYTCTSRKRLHNCPKKLDPKEPLEKFVVHQTLDYVLTPERIRTAARGVVRTHEHDYAASGIPEAEAHLRRIDADIKNATEALLDLPKAARQPLIDRLNLLDYERDEVTAQLALLKTVSHVKLNEDDVAAWIASFADGDPDDPAYCERLIDVFVNAVYVYDSEIGIFYNVRDELHPDQVTHDQIAKNDENPDDDRPGSRDGFGYRHVWWPITDGSRKPLLIFVAGKFGYIFPRFDDQANFR